VKRLVTGKIYRTNDMPWANAKVLFKRVNSSYTSSIQYPSDIIQATTDNLGIIHSTDSNQGVFLWTNESGNNISKYQCHLPGCEAFEFSLPVGVGDSIELGVLRIGSQPLEDYPQTLINYVDSSIDDAIVGIQAGSTQIFSNNFIASENLSALRIINLNTGTYANNSDLADSYSALGLTTSSINSGDSGKALIFGEFSDTSWNWLNSSIYLGANGNLTQTLTGNESFVLEVAKVKNASTILLEFKDIIILNS